MAGTKTAPKSTSASKPTGVTKSTKKPTKKPTKPPSKKPTKPPSKKPTKTPSKTPSKKPTKKPTKKPSKKPSKKPPPPPPTSSSSSSSSSPSQKTPFHLLPEGSGTTLSLPPTTPIPYIGTLSCFTCAALFVPISPTRAFLAHFNLEPLRPNGHPYLRQVLKNYEVGPACYRAVVMLTKEFLNAEQWKAGWGPVTQDMAEGVRMVCPNVGVGGRLYTGDAVVEGVREFFGGWGGGEGEVGEVRGEANIIVGFHQGEGGGEPVVMYPDEGEVARRWEGREVVRNDEFACADFRKDGRVLQGGTWEGPYPWV